MISIFFLPCLPYDGNFISRYRFYVLDAIPFFSWYGCNPFMIFGIWIQSKVYVSASIRPSCWHMFIHYFIWIILFMRIISWVHLPLTPLISRVSTIIHLPRSLVLRVLFLVWLFMSNSSFLYVLSYLLLRGICLVWLYCHIYMWEAGARHLPNVSGLSFDQYCSDLARPWDHKNLVSTHVWTWV